MTQTHFENAKSSIREARVAKAAGKIEKEISDDVQRARDLAQNVLTKYWNDMAYSPTSKFFAKWLEGATQEDFDYAEDKMVHYENIVAGGDMGVAAWPRGFSDLEVAAIKDALSNFSVNPDSVEISTGRVVMDKATYAKLEAKIAERGAYRVDAEPYLKAAETELRSTKTAKAEGKVDEKLNEEAASAEQYAKGILTGYWQDAAYGKIEEWIERKILRTPQEEIDRLKELKSHKDMVAMPQYAHIHEFKELEVAYVRDQLEAMGKNPEDLTVGNHRTSLYLPNETYARVQAQLKP